MAVAGVRSLEDEFEIVSMDASPATAGRRTRRRIDAAPAALAAPEPVAPPTERVKRRRLSLDKCGPSQKRRAQGTATPQVGSRPCPVEAVYAAAASGAFPLAALAEGPYLTVASLLSAADLCRTDASCRLLRNLNNLAQGPWQTLGERAFRGMELDIGGSFQSFERSSQPATVSCSPKIRYEYFHREVATFSPPFSGSEISNVEHPDEVSYCRCRLRTDLLAQVDSSETEGRGIYVEVDVMTNADNLSLAVVDFEGGGRSSVTFSPETGAVLRERKVRESPRAIEGTYMHLLPAASPGRRFEGTMGLYLCDGHLAFFRRWRTVSEPEGEGNLAGEGRTAGATAPAPAPSAAPSRPAAAVAAATGDAPMAKPLWENTGFCTDLRWAQGPRLSICLAFRDDGVYRVRIARVCRTPPTLPKRSQEAYQENKWSLLYGDDDHPLAI